MTPLFLPLFAFGKRFRCRCHVTVQSLKLWQPFRRPREHSWQPGLGGHTKGRQRDKRSVILDENSDMHDFVYCLPVLWLSFLCLLVFFSQPFFLHFSFLPFFL